MTSLLVKFNVRHYSADQHAIDLRKIDAFPSLADPGADAPHNSHGTASEGMLRMFVKCSARSEVPGPETKKTGAEVRSLIEQWDSRSLPNSLTKPHRKAQLPESLTGKEKTLKKIKYDGRY